MKKSIFVLLILFALAAVLGACASAPASETVSRSVTAADASGDPVSVASESGDVPAQPDAVPSGETGTAAVTRSADTVQENTAAAGTTAVGAASVAPGSSAGNTPSGSDPAVILPGISEAQSVGTTRSASAGTSAAVTPGSGKTTDSTVTSGGSTTPSGGSSATSGSGTSTAPKLRGDGVSGKRTYLKEAAVTYVSALNEEDLKQFGINGDKQNEILKNKSDWSAYTIQIDFVNNEAVPVTLYYLDVQDNGKGDVYVNGDTAGELGLGPGAKMTERFYVLAKKSDADGVVLRKLQDMQMRVQYAATPADDNVTPSFVYAAIQ